MDRRSYLTRIVKAISTVNVGLLVSTVQPHIEVLPDVNFGGFYTSTIQSAGFMP